MAIALLLAIYSVGVQPVEANRPFLTLDPGGHTAQVARVLFTPDSRQVLTVSLDKSIRVWDMKTGRTLRVLRPPIDDGYEGSLYTAALTGDGRLLAVAGYNKPGHAWGHIHLIALSENRLVRTLVGHTHDIIALAFSPDGKRLASGSRDTTAILWDVSTGAHRHVLQGHKGHVWGLAFSPDNLRLATASHDRTARVWEVETGRAIFSLNGHADKVNCIAWSPDGRTIATGGFDQRAVLYNPNGSIRQTYQPMGNVVTSLDFSGDSRRLLVTLGGAGSAVHSCHVLDLVQGRWQSRFEGHDQSVINGDLSPSGELSVTADGDGIVHVWRAADGTRHGPALVGQSKIPWSAGWSHDGWSLAWGNTDSRNSLEQLNPLERSFRPADLDFGGRPGAGFSGAQQTREPLRTRIPEGLKSVSILNGNRLQTSLRLPPEYSEDLVRCCTLLPGDLAVVGTDFKLYLYDTRTGTLTRTFQGHTAPVHAAAPAPGGRYFVSASGDMTLRVWSPGSDRPLLSLFFAEDEWIAWTPEGYYAASLGGEQLMGWQVNNGPDRMATYYPASRFRKTLYRPDVIKLVLEAGSTSRALTQANRQGGGPSELTEVSKVLPPKVRLLTPGRSGLQLPGDRLEVRAAAAPSGGQPVSSMRLLVNGRPHSTARTLFRDAIAREVTVSWRVDLPPGVHRLSAAAASSVSDSVSDEVDVIVPGSDTDRPGATATLFLMAVGINTYPSGIEPLEAAAPDARSISQSFLTHSKVLFKDVVVKLLLDGQATRAGIREAMGWLKARAKPGDVVVVFYAGHGVATGTTQAQWYLVPVDFKRNDLAGTSLNADELKQGLQIPCDTLLLLDACYAGSFNADRKRTLPEAADRAVRELVYDEGMVVMCGANKEQEAGEEASGQHGYFTRALMQGLGGDAKPDEDGVVDISALWAYVEPLVPKLSAGADPDAEPALESKVVRPLQAPSRSLTPSPMRST